MTVLRISLRPVYYHGGAAGLRVGHLLVPSPPHVEDGCPICVARAEGRTMRVGEYCEWLRAQGPEGERIAGIMSAAADPFEPVDPPSARAAVYVTTDVRYARWFAARSRGDLFEVLPIGELVPSPEDHFPAWSCQSAKIIRVLKRRVELSTSERRALLAAWKAADAAVAAAKVGAGR